MTFRIVYRARWDWDVAYATATGPGSGCFGDRSIFAVGDDGLCRSFAYATFGHWWSFAPAWMTSA